MDHVGHGVTRAPILVTGACGYLGRHVVDALAMQDIAAIGVSKKAAGDIIGCDLLTAKEVKILLTNTYPECIIHCAATVPKDTDGYDDSDAAEQSVRMAQNVARYAPCPVVFASSMTVYDDAAQGKQPYQEKAADTLPAGKYAQGKWTAETEMAELAVHGLIALRFPGLFGPPRRGGLLYNVARAFLTGRSFQVNSPLPVWAAFDVRDAAQACVRAALLNPFPKKEIVNIGYEGVFSIPEAVSILAELCGVDWDGSQLDAPRFQMDLKNAQKLIGLPSDSFRERLFLLVEEVASDLAQEKLEDA